jgi:hypothetical protein
MTTFYESIKYQIILTTDPIRPAMEEKHTEEWSPLLGEGHPSDADFFSPFMGNESLFETGYPASLRLALWLDFFLMAGEEGFKKKWPLLPTEEQKTLGIELLKCYLVQPLFLRLSQEERPSGAQGPRGRLF